MEESLLQIMNNNSEEKKDIQTHKTRSISVGPSRILSLTVATLAIFYATSAKAIPAPDWYVHFIGHSGIAGDSYRAGTGPFATDGYDLTQDLLKPPGTPSGAIEQVTYVDGRTLGYDLRSVLELNSPKTWEITFRQPSGFPGGINDLVWSLSQVPTDVNLTLTDFGLDETRSNPIHVLDLKQISEYSFFIPENTDPARYMNLTAVQVPEPGINQVVGAAAMLMLGYRKRE
jgi:hypothetical protein